MENSFDTMGHHQENAAAQIAHDEYIRQVSENIQQNILQDVSQSPSSFGSYRSQGYTDATESYIENGIAKRFDDKPTFDLNQMPSLQTFKDKSFTILDPIQNAEEEEENTYTASTLSRFFIISIILAVLVSIASIFIWPLGCSFVLLGMFLYILGTIFTHNASRFFTRLSILLVHILSIMICIALFIVFKA